MSFDPVMADLDRYLSQEEEREEVDPGIESLAASDPAEEGMTLEEFEERMCADLLQLQAGEENSMSQSPIETLKNLVMQGSIRSWEIHYKPMAYSVEVEYLEYDEESPQGVSESDYGRGPTLEIAVGNVVKVLLVRAGKP